MNEFEKYLENLADHEDEKRSGLDSRGRILVDAGIGLNWMGDYLANPELKWEKVEIPVEQLLFTGTSPEWNEILLEKCSRSVEKFKKLIDEDIIVKEKFKKEASFGDEPVLFRKAEEEGFYKVLDGMHRFVGAVLAGKEEVSGWLCVNEKDVKPICEAHVVYDLIRGFLRNAHDDDGREDLYHGLKLLSRVYGNVDQLLGERFNEKYVFDKDVQEVIKRVLVSNTAN